MSPTSGRRRARWLLLAGFCALGWFVPRVAYAEEAEPVEYEWYGEGIIAADVVSMTLIVLGPLTDPNHGEAAETMSGVGFAGYFLGAPIVHWAHRRVGRGFASLGLRFGAPLATALVGAGIGYAVDPSENAGDTAAAGAGVGIVVGFLAVPPIDASLLAYRPVPREDVSFVVLPSLRPNEVGAQFMGSF